MHTFLVFTRREVCEMGGKCPSCHNDTIRVVEHRDWLLIERILGIISWTTYPVLSGWKNDKYSLRPETLPVHTA